MHCIPQLYSFFFIFADKPWWGRKASYDLSQQYMGMVASMFKKKDQKKPRVEIESTQGSETDASKSSRVKFSNVRSHNIGTKIKPQMIDIGEIPPDQGRFKFSRTQSHTVGIGSNEDMRGSQTSVNTNSSALPPPPPPPPPANGMWNPILDPHDRTHWSNVYRSNLRKLQHDPKFYRGFKESKIWGEFRTSNGLTKVEEI